jgi:L-iditol 2-dehydrogenase
MTTTTTQSPATGSGLPATMRANILKSQGDMAMETLPLPPLDADQVLVQVAAVGVCGSDVHYYEHGRIGPYVVDHPLILGHELSGRIAAVGSAVDPSRVGKRVAVEPQRPCRKCKQCKAGRYNLCPDIEFYATPPIDGAFAEYVTIQSDFAYDIPDSVSDEAAALIEPLSVGLWACERAEIKPGSRVLIAGAGPNRHHRRPGRPRLRRHRNLHQRHRRRPACLRPRTRRHARAQREDRQCGRARRRRLH